MRAEEFFQRMIQEFSVVQSEDLVERTIGQLGFLQSCYQGRRHTSIDGIRYAWRTFVNSVDPSALETYAADSELLQDLSKMLSLKKADEVFSQSTSELD